MKRKHKITVAITVSLALAFVFLIWTFLPMVGPLIGIQRTPGEIVEWITRHNDVLLVNPVPLIKDRNGTYYDWANAEVEMRRTVSVVLWIAGIAILGLWATRRKHTKDIDNKASQSATAGKPGSG